MAPYTVVLVDCDARDEAITWKHVYAKSRDEAVDEAERIAGVTSDHAMVFPGHIEGAYVPGWAS